MNNIDEILENLTMNQKKEVPELNDLERQRVLNRTTDKINQKKRNTAYPVRTNGTDLRGMRSFYNFRCRCRRVFQA